MFGRKSNRQQQTTPRTIDPRFGTPGRWTDADTTDTRISTVDAHEATYGRETDRWEPRTPQR